MSVKSLNKVMLIGNVTRDPELRYTPQGNAVSTFGLATNRSWKTDGGELREEAEFHRLVAWNKLAELCSQLCTKGRKIYVEGRLQTRTFIGSDNAQHTITEIVIDDMILLDSKFPLAGTRPVPQASAGIQRQPSPPPEELEEEISPSDTSAVVTAAAADSLPKKKTKKAKKDEKASTVEQSPPTDTTQASQTEEKINIDDIPF